MKKLEYTQQEIVLESTIEELRFMVEVKNAMNVIEEMFEKDEFIFFADYKLKSKFIDVSNAIRMLHLQPFKYTTVHDKELVLWARDPASGRYPVPTENEFPGYEWVNIENMEVNK